MAYVFFDLDGTLTDSEEGILNSIRYSLSCLQRDIPDNTQLRKMIGPPLANGFSEVIGIPDDEIEAAIVFYREYFSTKGLFENRVYDDIPELLNQLKNEGHKLSVATSKPEKFAQGILKYFNLHQYFEFIVGASMDGSFSNKKDILAKAIKLSNADLKKSVMIGDREHDLLGASDNCIKSIGVTWGFGSLSELTGANATEIATAPNEIWKYIQSI